jgi:hypothetical protein
MDREEAAWLFVETLYTLYRLVIVHVVQISYCG